LVIKHVSDKIESQEGQQGMGNQKGPKQERGKRTKPKAPVYVTAPPSGVTRRDFVVTGAASSIAYGVLGNGAYEVLKVAGGALMTAVRPIATSTMATTIVVASGALIASGQECVRQEAKLKLAPQAEDAPEGFWGP